jgi:outer membrane biosynthesis protein TonB
MELVIFIAVAAIFAGVYWVLNKRQDVEESKTVLEKVEPVNDLPPVVEKTPAPVVEQKVTPVAEPVVEQKVIPVAEPLADTVTVTVVDTVKNTVVVETPAKKPTAKKAPKPKTVKTDTGSTKKAKATETKTTKRSKKA